MTARDTNDSCLSPATLAAFAEGSLTRQEIPAVLAHLENCPPCLHAVEQTSNLVERTRTRSRWLAIAAALALIAVAIPAMRVLLDRQARSPMERLVALSPRAARVVEPRLTGGFAYAPYEGPLRGNVTSTNAQRLKLAGAAGEIVERADREGSAETQHAAGVALVLVEQPLDAMTRLRAAAEQKPADAKLWNDVAAAEYAAAQHLARPSLYPEALAAADRALRADPSLPEALFNRALILERLGLPQQARETWERYLKIDPSSPWATEAREREKRLRSSTSEIQFRNEQPRLERAAASGDESSVRAIVARFPQQSRGFAEAEYLGRWGERNDASQLSAARSIGIALAATSGETLLRDAVHRIDTAEPDRRRALAAAQVIYRRGRLAYSRRELEPAERDLRLAAETFAAAGSPMARVARYYAASTRFDQNDIATARRELETLLAEVDSTPSFIALGAQIRWELALCHMIDDDWAGAVPLVQHAHDSFRRLGESSNLAVMETMLADAMGFLGRPEEAWAARIRALQILSDEGRGTRLPVSIGEAARMQLRVGRHDSARALLAIEEVAVGTDDVLRANTLARKAVLNRLMQDDDAARRDVREAFAAAQRIGDPSLRAWALADAQFAAGAVAVESDARGSAAQLTQAIDYYRASGKSFFLPEALLVRARARLQMNDGTGAASDLDAGIAEVERHRSQLAGAVTGTGVLDAGNGLYQDALRLRLDAGDVAGAFGYAERWRGNLAPRAAALVSAEELQRRLVGTTTAILELVTLPGEVVAFCVSASDVAVQRRPIARAQLETLIERGDESALYDILVRPSEPTLASARNLIIVADPTLEGVSFAALYDTTARQHLVERMPVALAPSSSALHADDSGSRNAASRSIVAVALPSGESSRNRGLPASGDELSEIMTQYANRTEIATTDATLAALFGAAARADVIHIAGHTERQPGLGDAALKFASNDAVSWRAIAKESLSRTSVVVLSACETLRVPRSAQARAMSLGGGFLAAGARDVIGTLVPLPDEQAYAMFTAIHRYLGRGDDAAQSLRSAQLEALAMETTSRRRTAWRAVALLTTRIPIDR
jgi:tetratricopeptide (TPR) repeat protein